jgi:hypothetical protein
LAYANSPAALADAGLREQPNSVIHCFEFTYDLRWKMLKRYLEATEASPAELDVATFQSLIRLGNERALLKSDWNAWKTNGKPAWIAATPTMRPRRKRCLLLRLNF